MRILICNWKDLRHPGAGGAEVYTHECARRWAAAGHEVTLFCAAVDGTSSLDATDGYLIVRRGSRFGVYAEARKYLRRHHRDFDVIVDEINTRPFFAHRHAGSTPVVALAHQVAREVWFDEMPLPAALLGRYVLEPGWLKSYAHVPTLTVSASSAESLAAYGLRNLAVVPEGVELSADVVPATEKSATPMLAFCGRLVTTKRPDHAIEGFARAAKRLGDGAELHVIGNGPLRDVLARRNVPGVVLHGTVDQRTKYDILGRAHALLATSRREGWGLVVSEAAAVGTPTIAYDVAGLRDSVPAANGVLVDANPDALADAIVAQVPRWRERPPAPLAFGGASSWDDVAGSVLVHLEAAAGTLPTGADAAPRPTSLAAPVWR